LDIGVHAFIANVDRILDTALAALLPSASAQPPLVLPSTFAVEPVAVTRAARRLLCHPW
jgi:hypothetical protein